MNTFFRHLFRFLITFPSCALSFHLNFYVLHYFFFPLRSWSRSHICLLFSYIFRSLRFLLLLSWQTLPKRMRILFAVRFFFFFIRIEFEFYLLQKINGLYRCHNPHKIHSFHFSTVVLFSFAIFTPASRTLMM